MASEKDLELLDQYVSNRLTGQDRTAFEQKLASDASLKNEFHVQQKVVGKLREARVKELKTMFNSIPASEFEATGTTSITQVALWLAVAGAIGLGVYFYFDSQNGNIPQDLSKQEQVTDEPVVPAEPKQDQPQTEESPAITQEDESSTDETVKTPAETKEDQDAPEGADGLKTEEEPKGPAPIDVFDPTEENKESSQRKNPSGVSESTPLTKSSIVVETDSENKKYDFHYQFKDGKLFLYGTFEKNLYEIMEFFSDNKRTVFLFYKDNYYLLNEDNDAVKPLSPISDPTLLKKLKDYRGTR